MHLCFSQKATQSRAEATMSAGALPLRYLTRPPRRARATPVRMDTAMGTIDDDDTNFGPNTEHPCRGLLTFGADDF
jgi:hypothetical protein